jgi:hypothetical protein
MDVSRLMTGVQKISRFNREPGDESRPDPFLFTPCARIRVQPHLRSDAAYSISVSVPVAISAAAQIRSRFNQARRRMPTPSFSNTSTAMNAVTAR